MPETLFDVLDPGLECGDVLLQLREVALEDLATSSKWPSIS
jgi:hypothetical protein